MNADVFSRYKRIAPKLEGWLPLDAAGFLHRCSEHQRRAGVSGNLCEIGVHHGRTSVLLGMLLAPGERLIVNDIFDLQQFNISTSGFGSEKNFLRNMGRCFKDLGFLTVIKKPSSDLALEETTDRCRIFVIDGGHTAEEAYSDLSTARRALLEQGLIMIDDYYNPEFPGVSEGVCRFMSEHREIIPWAFCFNQLFLIRRAASTFFDDLIDSELFGAYCREERLVQQRRKYFGRDLLILRKLGWVSNLIHRAEMKARLRPELFIKIKGGAGYSWLRRLYQRWYRPQ